WRKEAYIHYLEFHLLRAAQRHDIGWLGCDPNSCIRWQQASKIWIVLCHLCQSCNHSLSCSNSIVKDIIQSCLGIAVIVVNIGAAQDWFRDTRGLDDPHNS